MKRLLLTCLAGLGLAGCNQMESDPVSVVPTVVDETRDSVGTLIRPVAAFAQDLPRLGLFLPGNGTRVSGPVAFVFDTTRSPQGMLLLFDRDPGTLVGGRLSSAWSASGCLGGLVSMAGMTWNGSALLDGTERANGFHACGSSEHEPIDPTRPLTIASLADGAKVWWVVVGYDARLHPVAASPVYFFTWSRNP